MVGEHRDEYSSQWAAIEAISEMLGMSAETLRKWVRQNEIDGGGRAGLTTNERQRLRELEREVKDLRRANEILREASIFFATELDGRRKK
jgi:transposase